MFANDHLVNISTQTFYNSSQFRNIKKKWYPSLVKFTEKKKHKRWKMGWGLCSYTAIRNSVTKQHCKQTNKEP